MSVSIKVSDEPDPLAAFLDQRHAAGGIVDVNVATVKLVIFRVGTTAFAFSSQQVLEILPLLPIYFVPGCPTSMEGVIHLRGDIASVLRLGEILGLEHAPPCRHAAILLAQTQELRSGIRVDRVLDVLDVEETQLQPPPETLPERWRPLAMSVFQYQTQAVVVLDLARLFRDYHAGTR